MAHALRCSEAMACTKYLLPALLLILVATGCAAEVEDTEPAADTSGAQAPKESFQGGPYAGWNADGDDYCPPGRIDKIGDVWVEIPSACRPPSIVKENPGYPWEDRASDKQARGNPGDERAKQAPLDERIDGVIAGKVNAAKLAR